MELDKLKEIIAAAMERDADDITEDTDFVKDLGADSLDIMQIVMGIEDEFGIEIPDEKLTTIVTVGDALEEIQNAL